MRLQVLRSLGLMADLDIDELESLAQRVEMAKHQVYSVTQLLVILHKLFVDCPYMYLIYLLVWLAACLQVWLPARSAVCIFPPAQVYYIIHSMCLPFDNLCSTVVAYDSRSQSCRRLADGTST